MAQLKKDYFPGLGICGAFGIDANGTRICSPGDKVVGSMKEGSEFRMGIWFLRGEATWNVSCTMRYLFVYLYLFGAFIQLCYVG